MEPSRLPSAPRPPQPTVTQVSIRAGNLALCYDRWKQISSDPAVLDSVRGVSIPFSVFPVQTAPPPPFHPRGRVTVSVVRGEIQKLISWRAARICSPSLFQVVNPFFLVDEPDLSYRFILSLSWLNLFIAAPHFKLEDGRTAARFLSRGDWLAKVDLQNPHYSVPVHPESSRFLMFSFEGTLFEFTCLPFGLNLAPFLFTKLMRALLLFLREQGFRSVNYLDDFLLLGSSASECLSNIHQTTSLLTQLGFTVNLKKNSVGSYHLRDFPGTPVQLPLVVYRAP